MVSPVEVARCNATPAATPAISSTSVPRSRLSMERRCYHRLKGRPLMLNISAQQLADLLVGIARAQAAVIDGVDTAMPGTKTQYIVPALRNAAHLLDHPDPTLTDLPVRILLSAQGRVPPNPAQIAQQLERLLGSRQAAEPSASSALDFSAPRSA